MKLHIRLFSFLLMAFAAAGAFAQERPQDLKFPLPKAFTSPKVESYTLKNGIRVFMLEDKELPLVDISVVVRTGSCMEPTDKLGLASLTGNVLRQGGSAKYPADTLNRILENRAASMESGISMTNGSVSMNALKEDFAALLPIFVDVMMNPAFPQDKLDLARKQQKSGISRRNDNAQGIATREFGRLVYGADSPYGRLAQYYTLDKVKREDVAAFHKQHFVGNNMFIGIVGDFDPATMKKLLAQYFEGIPAGKKTELNLPAVSQPKEATVNLVEKSDVNQSVVAMGHLGGRRLVNGKQNPDYAPLQVMNEVLSGGFSGRLFQKVRTDMGLAYSVFGVYESPSLYDGRFYAGVMTKSSTSADAISAIDKEIKRLQNEPVSEKELADAKDRFLNGIVFKYDSRSKIMFEKLIDAYNGLPANAFEEYVEGVKKVTVADIQRVAKQHLKPEVLQILVVGNAKEIGNQLERFGRVNKIDVTIPTAEPGAKPATAAVPKGDPIKGMEYLNKMADAVLKPGTTLKTLNYTGTSTQYNERMPGGKMEMDINVTYYHPDSMKQKVTLAAMNMQMEIVYKDGQLVQRMMGQERAMPGTQMKAALDRDYVVMALKRKQLKADYMGNEKVGDKDCIKLQVVPDKEPVTLYLDAATYLPVQLTYNQLNPMEGKEEQFLEVFGNWKEADGLNYAYSRKVTTGEKTVSESKLTGHSLNK